VALEVVLVAGGRWLVVGGLGVALFLVACEGETLGKPTTELTIINAAGEDVGVYIDGQDSRLGDGDADTVTVVGAGEFMVVINGLDSNRTLYLDNLSVQEINDRNNQVVVKPR
jgi:hypothetical protein